MARRYTVFEAVNKLRREVYVGATTSTVSQAIEDIRRQPPLWLASWNLGRVNVRSVAFGLTRREASRLVQERERRSLLAGWTTSVL